MWFGMVKKASQEELRRIDKRDKKTAAKESISLPARRSTSSYTSSSLASH